MYIISRQRPASMNAIRLSTLRPASRRLVVPRKVLSNDSTAFWPAATQLRTISRFPDRNPGSGRLPKRRTLPKRLQDAAAQDQPLESQPTVDDSPLWTSSRLQPPGNPSEGLRKLLSHDTLVITRQIEMLNLFMGFEQANRYAINNVHGEVLGYIAEEQRSFLSVMSRQVFRTHRPFRALILDAEGTPIIWLRRPFAWINSRMFVQRIKEGSEYTQEGDPILETFAEVQQRWHLWRRRYDLFISDSTKPILSHIGDRQPEPREEMFSQFARIDGGFLAWTFLLHDAREEEIASITRSFRGFGREIFTDTGQYLIRFTPAPREDLEQPSKPTIIRQLSLEEKALTLATAVNIDFDYFSRHSEGGHMGFLPLWWGGGDE